MNQPLPAVIAASALATASVGLVVVMLVGAIRAPAAAGGSPRPRAPRLLGGIVVALAAFGLLSAVAALPLMLLSAALLEAGAPKVVYVFTAALAGFVLWRGVAHSSYGMEGCTKSAMLAWGAYGLGWSAASLWLIPETAPASWSAGAVIRPFAVAALPALAAYRLVARKKGVQALGVLVFLAALTALTFLPVERGLAHDWLPPSDWLRFPLAGLLVTAGLLLLPQLAQLASGWRSSARRRKEMARTALRTVAFGGAFGALLGLLWAVTRAVETAI